MRMRSRGNRVAKFFIGKRSPEHGYFSAEKFLELAPVALASLRQALASKSIAWEAEKLRAVRAGAFPEIPRRHIASLGVWEKNEKK